MTKRMTTLATFIFIAGCGGPPQAADSPTSMTPSAPLPNEQPASTEATSVETETSAPAEARDPNETTIQRIHRIALKPGDLLFESVQQYIDDHQINDGAIISAIGSLSECNILWPEKPEFPPKGAGKKYEGALEIASMQGMIAGGKPHLHLIVAKGGDAQVMGGHLGQGCKILYLGEITLAEFVGPRWTRRKNEHGVEMLQPE